MITLSPPPPPPPFSQLEIGYNPFGPDGMKVLSEILKFHGNVKALKLGWCQVDPYMFIIL
jgi:hypothetical protein